MQFNCTIIEVNGFGLKVYADSCHVAAFELLAYKTKNEVGFSDSAVSDDDEFGKYVVALHVFSQHLLLHPSLCHRTTSLNNQIVFSW